MWREHNMGVESRRPGETMSNERTESIAFDVAGSSSDGLEVDVRSVSLDVLAVLASAGPAVGLLQFDSVQRGLLIGASSFELNLVRELRGA
jgi:hypothetical protein